MTRKLLAGILVLGALASCSMAQSTVPVRPRIADGFSTDWAGLTMDVRELAPGVYLLHGSGGNTLASIGPDGTLLVDVSFAPVAPKVKGALAELKAGPVRYVVSTHYHPDHSGGNEAFHADGAVIVAQENCRVRMTKTQVSTFWGSTSLPAPVGSLPTITYDRRMELVFNGEQITLFHNQPAHTDGDTIVYLRQANVMHMGDMFVNNLYPYIDLGAGGTIDGYFPVLDEALAMMNEQTKVVPGHGPLATKKELQGYREMLKTVRDRVAAQVTAGKTLEAILASRPSQEFDAQYATNRVDGDGFTVMVYQSLTGKRMDWKAK